MSLKAQYSDIKTKHLALADLVKPFISSVKVLTLEAYELLHRNHCSVFATLTSLFDSALGELEKAQNPYRAIITSANLDGIYRFI